MEIGTTKNIYDSMVNKQFIVSIMGCFNQELLMNLIAIADKKLSIHDTRVSIKRKIFHFMVECSQSLLKTEREELTKKKNIFLISQEQDNYNVHLGATVPKSSLKSILDAVSEVNSINSSEIHKKYMDELKYSRMTEEHSALLSLLSISKKTKKKIDCELVDISETSSFVSFKMTITA